ncbi:MAG TPA: hypothetical protein VNQ77_08055 [Frankiaceae bacterium]|nr:hypothetical protein [Frankiaceae bacterium]
MPVTLAHGGGIPEALTVIVPLALVVVMLRLGAKKMPPEDEPPEPPADAPPPALPPD